MIAANATGRNDDCTCRKFKRPNRLSRTFLSTQNRIFRQNGSGNAGDPPATH